MGENAPAIWTRYTSGEVGFSLAGSVDNEVSKSHQYSDSLRSKRDPEA